MMTEVEKQAKRKLDMDALITEFKMELSNLNYADLRQLEYNASANRLSLTVVYKEPVFQRVTKTVS